MMPVFKTQCQITLCVGVHERKRQSKSVKIKRKWKKKRWCDNVTMYSCLMFPKIHLQCLPGCCSAALWPSKSPHICCHTVTYYCYSKALCRQALLLLWKVHFVFQGTRERQGNIVHSDVLSGCSATASVGMFQGQRPVRSVSRIHWILKKGSVSPQGWHRPVSGLLFLWTPSWLTSDGPQSNMMDHLLRLLSCCMDWDQHHASSGLKITQQSKSEQWCNNSM